ncbi:MAG: hypothetical protein ABSB71_08000 [Candidatus Bathyarchaeia archaeon]|jgi:hypothetical protein
MSSIGNKIANRFIRYRNEWVRNPQKKRKELYVKAKKVGSYMNQVGVNVVHNVMTDAPSDMMPFRMPQQTRSRESRRVSQVRRRRERIERRGRKKRQRQSSNPYPLI